jgi:hypothetical protein
MKRIIVTVISLVGLFLFSTTAEAATGSMVHNGPDKTTGYVTVPWASGHYSTVPSVKQTGVPAAPPFPKTTTTTTAKKTTVKYVYVYVTSSKKTTVTYHSTTKKSHFKSAATRKKFLRWWYATHK